MYRMPGMLAHKALSCMEFMLLHLRTLLAITEIEAALLMFIGSLGLLLKSQCSRVFPAYIKG